MPRYMLDTNMVIYLMKNQPKEVAEKFSHCLVGDVVMSAITYAELQYGATVSVDPRREHANLRDLVADIPVAPFDASTAEAYGPVRKATRDRKKDQLDKLIAAQAIALDVVLVTNNERDFMHYPGVRLENWLTQ